MGTLLGVHPIVHWIKIFQGQKSLMKPRSRPRDPHQLQHEAAESEALPSSLVGDEEGGFMFCWYDRDHWIARTHFGGDQSISKDIS